MGVERRRWTKLGVLASEGWWEAWQPSPKIIRSYWDKVGRPPSELGVSKSMECDIFPSVLWHCWLGDRKGNWPVKNWMLVCWWWWFGWSFARLITPVVTTAAIILCFNKHRLTQVHLENGRWNGEGTRTKLGERAFSASGHTTWNSVPESLRTDDCTYSNS